MPKASLLCSKKIKPFSKTITNISFALVLTAQIGFVIYKADYTGITYDEATTLECYTKSVHEALTSYKNPNNHVLNSLFMHFTHKYFNSYEHFIRIHSIVFAILFSTSIAYIIHKTIESNILKIALLILVILNWFVFDLSFLARGYSVALGAVYAGIALILGLLSNKIKYAYYWVPIAAIVLMNFLTLGAMLTGIFVLFSINIIFILLYSYYVFRDAPNKRTPLLLNLLSVPSLTFVLLYLLYKEIYRDVLQTRYYSGQAHFGKYIKNLLADTMVAHDGSFSLAVYSAFIFLTSLSVAFGIYQFWLKIKESGWQKCYKTDDLGNFILLVTVVTALTMFIHCAVLNMPPGFTRNGVFLVPLALLSAGILLDRFWKNLKANKVLNLAVKVCMSTTVILLALQNLPSPYAVEIQDWKIQSASKLIARKLKYIDPNKMWKIKLSEKAKFVARPLNYYTQFDYKIRVVADDIWDVVIAYKTEKPDGAICLDEELFSKFNCCAIIRPQKIANPTRH